MNKLHSLRDNVDLTTPVTREFVSSNLIDIGDPTTNGVAIGSRINGDRDTVTRECVSLKCNVCKESFDCPVSRLRF